MQQQQSGLGQHLSFRGLEAQPQQRYLQQTVFQPSSILPANYIGQTAHAQQPHHMIAPPTANVSNHPALQLMMAQQLQQQQQSALVNSNHMNYSASQQPHHHHHHRQQQQQIGGIGGPPPNISLAPNGNSSVWPPGLISNGGNASIIQQGIQQPQYFEQKNFQNQPGLSGQQQLQLHHGSHLQPFQLQQQPNGGTIVTSPTSSNHFASFQRSPPDQQTQIQMNNRFIQQDQQVVRSSPYPNPQALLIQRRVAMMAAEQQAASPPSIHLPPQMASLQQQQAVHHLPPPPSPLIAAANQMNVIQAHHQRQQQQRLSLMHQQQQTRQSPAVSVNNNQLQAISFPSNKLIVSPPTPNLMQNNVAPTTSRHQQQMVANMNMIMQLNEHNGQVASSPVAVAPLNPHFGGVNSMAPTDAAAGQSQQHSLTRGNFDFSTAGAAIDREPRMTLPMNNGIILAPFQLQHGLSISSVSFCISEEVHHLLMSKQTELDLQMKCFYHEDRTQSTSWPASVSVKVNGHNLLEASELPNPQLSAKPLFIKQACRPGKNLLEIAVKSCCCSHRFLLELVQRPSVLSIEQNIIRNHLLPTERSIAKIRRFFGGGGGGGGDNEQSSANAVAASAETVSLVCPLTTQPILTPVRGSECRHIRCFDLRAFLLVNSNRSPEMWSCPICRRFPMYFDKLEVDQYMWDICGKMKQQQLQQSQHQQPVSMTVVIDGDANWRPMSPPPPSSIAPQQHHHLQLEGGVQQLPVTAQQQQYHLPPTPTSTIHQGSSSSSSAGNTPYAAESVSSVGSTSGGSSSAVATAPTHSTNTSGSGGVSSWSSQQLHAATTVASPMSVMPPSVGKSPSQTSGGSISATAMPSPPPSVTSTQCPQPPPNASNGTAHLVETTCNSNNNNNKKIGDATSISLSAVSASSIEFPADLDLNFFDDLLGVTATATTSSTTVLQHSQQLSSGGCVTEPHQQASSSNDELFSFLDAN